MLKEQHLRKVEEYLSAAIQAAEIAGLTEKELTDMLQTLINVDEED